MESGTCRMSAEHMGWSTRHAREQPKQGFEGRAVETPQPGKHLSQKQKNLSSIPRTQRKTGQRSLPVIPVPGRWRQNGLSLSGKNQVSKIQVNSS